MPIAPRFSLEQTDTHVLLRVQVPHIRVTAVQVSIEDNGQVVHVAASPVYLLKLNFAPYQFIVDDDDETESETKSAVATYEPSSSPLCQQQQHVDGTVRIVLEKQQPRHHWDNLDWIGRLVVPPAACFPTKPQPPIMTTTTPQRQPLSFTRGLATTSATATSTPAALRRRWLREVVAGPHADDAAAALDPSSLEQAQKQKELKEPAMIKLAGGRAEGYGFAHLFHTVLTDLIREDGWIREMLEGHEAMAGGADPLERRRQRRAMEQAKFSVERYRGDLCGLEEDYLYQCAMAMIPHWRTDAAAAAVNAAVVDSLAEAPPQQQESPSFSFFTPDEHWQLQSIPYPLLPPSVLVQTSSSSSTSSCGWTLRAGLVDLLFAYVYDHLLTEGEATVESAWTVSILSASLSWLDDPYGDDDNNNDCSSSSACASSSSSFLGMDCDNNKNNNKDTTTTTTHRRHDHAVRVVEMVIHSSLHRALIYPYFRNLDFALYCLHQVEIIVRGGQNNNNNNNRTRMMIMRCLLQLRRILDRSELYYLGNTLYIDPYLAWLQQQPTKQDDDDDWNALADAIQHCRMQDTEQLKAALDLDVIRIQHQQEEEASFLSCGPDDRCNPEDHGADAISTSSSTSSCRDEAFSEKHNGSDDDVDDDDDDESDDGSSSSSDDDESIAGSNNDTARSQKCASGSSVKDGASARPTDDESLSRNFLELDLGCRSDPMDLFCVTVPPNADDTASGRIKGPLIQEM